MLSIHFGDWKSFWRWFLGTCREGLYTFVQFSISKYVTCMLHCISFHFIDQNTFPSLNSVIIIVCVRTEYCPLHTYFINHDMHVCVLPRNNHSIGNHCNEDAQKNFPLSLSLPLTWVLVFNFLFFNNIQLFCWHSNVQFAKIINFFYFFLSFFHIRIHRNAIGCPLGVEIQNNKTAMKPLEVQEKLGLTRIRDRNWYVQPSCATSGDGLCEGLTWLTSNHKLWD